MNKESYTFLPSQEHLLYELQTILQQSNYKTISRKVKCSYKDDVEKFIYYFKVWELTEEVCKYVKDIGLRGKGYHLDHIIPISYGFKYGLPHTQIGSIENLQIISHKENFIKNSPTNLPKKDKIIREKIYIRKEIPTEKQPSLDDRLRLSSYPNGGNF